ncbi:MAG TPA: multidrug efflux RND transporter permease subunit [Syntrophales bacterium]|nr:multidrug efflux RND transporter permease subunit [Syntrophales bacterium]HQG33984.1 multidrug efflux RND transporter permease subunit [Syntrophales bacterium]HRU88539.1 multidrug efflux RND transporter permease subunit [Syntrophales bacterium]
MISRFFIDRPIFAAVISIVIVLAGGVAMFNLPIAQYPEISPPQVQVSANYPGASAEVIAQNVASPIELQVNGADNMIYMNSVSTGMGTMTLTVFFDIGTNPDMAQVDVQNRVNIAMPQLPQSVQQQGVTVQKKSSSFLMVIGIYSPDGRYDQNYVANYANLYVLDALKRIEGANQTAILGSPDYAMRIWLKPDRMAQLGITASDVSNAIAQQNQQFAVGKIGQSPTDGRVEQTFSVTTKGRLTTPQEFENIILRASKDGSAIVRLRDVGRAQLGAKDYSVRTKMNGKTATLLAVYQQPGANAVHVSDQVKKTLEQMKKNFPDGIDYKIAMDSTEFVRASIKDVIITFFEACLLVILVVYIFLQSARATIIPILAVPISIIGTAIGMILFGFSINMLTLFGMVLAIGIVVDDAIVVIENVERNMEEFHLPPKEAAKKAMDEVTGPVIAIVLVLCAVFVPVAFLGGMTGQLYKQFAITIAISVVFSGIVALTLSPALAALLLRHKTGENKGFFKWFETFFLKITNGYTGGVAKVLRSTRTAMIVFVVMAGLTGFMFHITPTSFVPAEDQGYLFGITFLPDTASLDRTEEVGGRAAQFFMKHPAVQDVSEFAGYSLVDGALKANAGVLFISLKDFEQRKKQELQAPAILHAAFRSFSQIKEGLVMPSNPPSIPGLGNMGGFQFWILNRGDGDAAKLQAVTAKFIAQCHKQPELHGVNSTMNAYSQQLRVDVDREKAETLGVPVQNVYETLQILFGSAYVSQFNKFSRLWQVIVQAEPQYRSRPNDLTQVYVRSTDGRMVPLQAVVTMKYESGPDIVNRFNNFPAANVIGGAAPGYSSGQAIAAMERVAKEVLPEDFSFAWSGEAFYEKQAGGTSGLVFVFGLIMVFLILAAQYEKWSLPFGVLMAVPFALFGAVLSILLRGIENDIYFQIGLLTLIALAAKNGILITEFAVMKRAEGLSVYDAALEAARLRLRPIVMTSIAFILGCVPLAIATGASANSRHSIGTGVIGGMLGATLIAIFFIPMFFQLFETLSARREKKGMPSPDVTAVSADPSSGKEDK